MSTFVEIQTGPEWQNLALPAREQYSPDLPYHNWQHALDVASNVVDLANRSEHRGQPFPIGILAVAAAWHDAGYQQNHLAEGYATKELYSAALAERHLLATENVPTAYVAAVKRAIIGTTHKADRTDLTTLALHRADIADIAGSYELFASNSRKLLLEARMHSSDLSFAKFSADSQRFIDEVIAESGSELARLSEPNAGPDSFIDKAIGNKQRLSTETEASLLKR